MNTSNASTILVLIQKGNYYRDTRNNLDLTLNFILLIFGLFGNICIVLLMKNKNLSKLTVSAFLISLAISDSFVLIFDSFVVWLDLVIPSFTLEEATDCKIYFPSAVCKLVSSWIVINISLDRFISVFYPAFAKRFITKKSCMIRVAALIVLSFLVNLYYLILISSPDDSTYDCQGEEPIWHQKVWPIMFTFLYSIIPSILLIILNVMIIKRATESKRNFKKVSNRPINNEDNKGPKKLNLAIIAICSSFILLTLPANILNIFTIHVISEGSGFADEKVENQEYQEKRSKILYFLLVRWITDFMENINHSINFFLYVLSSQMFRHEFVLMLKSRLKIKVLINNNNKNKVHPSPRVKY